MSGTMQHWMRETTEEDFDHLNSVNDGLIDHTSILEDLYASLLFDNLTKNFPNRSPEFN